MWRWLLAIFVALLVLDAALPFLQRLGIGQLPGDFRFKLFGRVWSVPLTSTVVLSLIVSLLVKWL